MRKTIEQSLGSNLEPLKPKNVTKSPIELSPTSETDATDLVAPKNILHTETQARIILDDLLRDHSTRFNEYAKIYRQYNCNRPRNAKKLAEKGLAYLSNFNNGHARIHVNKYLSSEYNLIHSVATPITTTVTLLNDPKYDVPISKAMARAFTKVYAKHPEFYNQIDIMREDKALYGISSIIREPNSWKFKAISSDQFLCPLSTGSSKENLTKFVILHKMSPQQLWKIYDELDESGNDYWNKQSLGYVLYRSSQAGSSRRSDTFTSTSWSKEVLDMEHNLKNYNKSIVEYYKDDIEVASVYIKEYDGEWSHTIIHQQYKTTKPLFFRSRQYKKLNDFFNMFLFEPGKKTLLSVRGLAYRLYQPIEVQNRLDNIAVDKTAMDGTVFIRSRKGRNRDAKSVKITLGAINDIGEAEFVQQMNQANLNTTLALNNYQAGLIERNVNYEGMDIENPTNTYKSMGEVGLQATQDAVLTKPQVSYFYSQMDTFYQDTFRLAYEYKDDYFKRFEAEVKRLIAHLKLPEEIIDLLFRLPRGVEDLTESGLPFWLDVMATRSTSSGSQVADIIATNRMFQLATFMNTDERYTFLQNATAAFHSHEVVQLYFPDGGRPDVLTNSMQKAIIESALLMQGTEIPVAQEDDHREETPVHFNKCMEVIQMYAGGQMEPIAADEALRQLYPHALAHFLQLSQDPLSRAIFESLAPQRGEIENQFKMIQANANAQRVAQQKAMEREQQQRLEQMMRGGENSPEHLKVEMDAILAERKMMAEETRKNFSENIRAIRFDTKSKLEDQIKTREFLNKQAREDAKTVAQIRNDSVKSSVQKLPATRKPRV